MQEETLRKFFEGEATASELAEDVAGSKRAVSSFVSVVHVADMDKGFKVDRKMAISLCDVLIAGLLPPAALSVIGFALMASDKFCWDEDDLLSDVIGDWSCPEINYPLTIENITRFKAWLEGSEPYPSKPSPTEAARGRVVSVTEKKALRR